MPGECPVLLDGLLIATHEVKEELLVASDMAIEIHAHETRKLDETGINVPQEARVQKRHLSNDILAEPFGAVLLGETINNCWIYACIDRSAQQNDRCRRMGIANFLHE